MPPQRVHAWDLNGIVVVSYSWLAATPRGVIALQGNETAQRYLTVYAGVLHAESGYKSLQAFEIGNFSLVRSVTLITTLSGLTLTEEDGLNPNGVVIQDALDCVPVPRCYINCREERLLSSKVRGRWSTRTVGWSHDAFRFAFTSNVNGLLGECHVGQALRSSGAQKHITGTRRLLGRITCSNPTLRVCSIYDIY